MDVSRASIDTDADADGSLQSTILHLRPGNVVKLQHPRYCSQDPAHSFALYCGRARVIHAWSSSRANFRVRVDTLRSLVATGITVSDSTEELDAYCANVLGATPLSAELIVPRAQRALHCQASGRRSSLPLILYARYGDSMVAMVKSLISVLKSLIRLSAPQGPLSSGEISLRDVLCTILHLFDKKNYVWPRRVPEQPRDQASVATFGLIEALVKRHVDHVQDINSILCSDVEPLMAAWIMHTFKRATKPVEFAGVGLPLSQLGIGAKYVRLALDAATKQFLVLLDTDMSLVARLARERMECGICFVHFNDTAVVLLQCSHALCVACFKMLTSYACPYCRKQILFIREMDSAIKLVANDRIRQSECLALASNDVDAPASVATKAQSTATPVQGDGDGSDETISTDTKTESDESVARLAEAVNSLAV